MEFLMVFGPLGYVLYIIVVVAWIILPFIVYGVKKKIETLINIQKESLSLLKEIRSNTTLQSSDQPSDRAREVKASRLLEEVRKVVEEKALDGDYSKAGIAISADISETEVEYECIRLYDIGVLTRDQCERVIGRKLTSKEIE